MANHRNDKEKFWSLVKCLSRDECWEWQGSLWASGYGRFHYDKKSDRSHRLAWQFSRHRIGDDDCILHKCDNRKCCNPHHLFVGSRKDNNDDKTRKGRQSKGTDFERTILSEGDVRTIKRSDLSGSVLSEKFGVSACHINNIKKDRKWKHVKV